MSRHGNRTPRKSNSATPRIGIHSLAEFRFCPRAGFLSHHQKSDDTGCDRDQAYLFASLPFRHDDIHREYNDVFRRLIFLTLILPIAVITSTMLWRIDFRIPSAMVLPLFAWLIPVYFRLWQRCLRLLGLMRHVEGMQPREPKFVSSREERINWWELWKAGYAKAGYTDVLIDRDMNIAGRPWCILRRGDEVIPAYRRSKSGRLQPQQRLRIQAYCQLISAVEGARVPFGVILDADGYHATAIQADENDSSVATQLSRMRHLLNGSGNSASLPRPANLRTCIGCPHGRPRVFRAGETETEFNGRPLTANCQPAVDGRNYHSPCGDAFEWTPPHVRAFEKRLVAEPSE